MLLLTLLMFLIGCALGIRFRVLILLPAIGLVCMAYVTAGVARGDGISAMIVAGALAAICLQIGYLAGAMMPHAPLTSRASKISRSAYPAEKLR